jgi:hypothetical protein
MASGECRWVGRESVHVYCVNPMRLQMMPTGREGWLRDASAARYRVVTETRDYEGQEWMTLGEAAAVVAKEAAR